MRQNNCAEKYRMQHSCSANWFGAERKLRWIIEFSILARQNRKVLARGRNFGANPIFHGKS